MLHCDMDALVYANRPTTKKMSRDRRDAASGGHVPSLASMGFARKPTVPYLEKCAPAATPARVWPERREGLVQRSSVSPFIISKRRQNR